jgi:hypothetical protein
LSLSRNGPDLADYLQPAQLVFLIYDWSLAMNDPIEIPTDHLNPDAITGEPASHPGATGIGAAAGAASGAVAGALGGPIGVVVGAVAGGIVGGLMGHEIGEWHDPSDEIYWRKQYQTSSFYDHTADFDQDVAPALQYGGLLAAKACKDCSNGVSHLYQNLDSLDGPAAAQWETAKRNSRYTYAQARQAIHNAYIQKLRQHEDTMLSVAVYRDA